jgi:ABC-type transporter MlaC component
MRQTILASVLFSLLSFSAAAFAQDAAGPQVPIEKFLDSIRAMEFPPADAAAQARHVQEANALLDIETLSRKSLEGHWEAFTPEQRETFLRLMGQLIEHVAYPKSRRFMGNYEITYPSVTPSGDGHNVQSVIRQEEQGLDAEVIYHVSAAGKIDDVILDGVSMTEDLKYQFDKILAESQFSGLVEKMEKRLADAKREGAPAV